MRNLESNISVRRTFSALIAASLVASAAVAQPVLTARIDGVIVNSFDTVQFPAPAAVGQSLRIVVALRNEGNQTLSFTSNPPVSLAGGFSDQFALIQPALETGGTLSPNGSTALAIDLAPNAPIESVFTNMFIFTNASASPFRLRFEGAVAVPKMRVAAGGQTVAANGDVDFGQVRLGESGELLFELFNDGAATLELTNAAGPVSLSAGNQGFELLEQPSATIEPGESSSFRVAFTPAEAVSRTVTMSIETNTLAAPQFGLFNATLSAEGLPIDCNGNNVADADDIGAGTSLDCNANGIPDDCELDSDSDGIIDDCETTDPNVPVVDDNDEDPNAPVADDDNDDVVDPNTPTIDDEDNNDNVDLNTPVFDANEVTDPNDLTNDEQNNDQFEEDIIVPTSFCGFGVGFASLMSMASLGGYRRGRRARR